MIHSIRRTRPRVGKRTPAARAGAAKMPRRGKRGRHGRGRMRRTARRLSAQRRQCGPPRLPRKKIERNAMRFFADFFSLESISIRSFIYFSGRTTIRKR
ncbi:hypothetical protein [Burkholderia pseudomallei]|uniref:hypothetical protein n=1 Tax=Burkholderia pseudomallei TaxID=28450 RepID=UPI00314046C3